LPENVEMVLPGAYASTLIFAAEPGVAPSPEPVMVALRFRPIVKGKALGEFVAREFPLVITGPKAEGLK
jgi:hypothetical protein